MSTAPTLPTAVPVSGSIAPKVSSESKSGWPKTIAIAGVSTRSVSVEITDWNAMPMTKATASSTKLPRLMNSLNSAITTGPSAAVTGRSTR